MMPSFNLAPVEDSLLLSSLLCLILNAVLLYSAVLALARIAGRKQLAQRGPTELVAMRLISNAVQDAMDTGGNSLLGDRISATAILDLSLISDVTFKRRAMCVSAYNRIIHITSLV